MGAPPDKADEVACAFVDMYPYSGMTRPAVAVRLAATLRAHAAEAVARAEDVEKRAAIATEALSSLAAGAEHVQCLVARHGEMTYECGIGAPCVACRARQRVAASEKRAERLAAALRNIAMEANMVGARHIDEALDIIDSIQTMACDAVAEVPS